MNSDPFDSAAWRTFNLLDADEATLFDEARRNDLVLQRSYLEMDRLAAAIAATTAAPISPPDGQLERLQSRLGLRPSRPSHFRLAVAGWATTAVLSVLLTLHLTGIIDRLDTPTSAATATPPRGAQSNNRVPAVPPPAGSAADLTDTSHSSLAQPEPSAKSTIKVETKRLVQEIAVLRDNLANFQHRDRVLFEVVPGMALPIVMTMNPPGLAAEDPATLAQNDARAPLTTLLGTALTEMTGAAGDSATTSGAVRATTGSGFPEHAMAIPIYDAARDVGTLVVSNLPTAASGQAYNLWVITATGNRPIYVGSLPENSAAGADSFDFSLGSTMVLPAGFVLTIDPQDAPASPTSNNTVLQGPPIPPP